ncbi:MAG TPA: zinc ribbon domain-containing protein [Thermoplasmata archaeon]|nr:zinc ribbon domain-containing protein [Thermoplasmata archaeon]
MSELTGLEIGAIIVVVILAVVVAALLLYLLRRLKNRRAKLISELEDRPELNQDRAFNRLAMARREAGVLSGQGVDIQRAQELIAEGQAAFDLRRFDRAYEAAQSAHEALVNARLKGTRTTGVPLPSSEPSTVSRPVSGAAAPAAAVLPATAASTEETPPRRTIPKYRAESQFQIRLLTEELEGLPARRRKDSTAVQAGELKRQASAAFDREEYSEAFRLALKGRRTLGGTLESLPPTGTGTSPPSPAVGNGSARAPDLTRTAETVAGGERCPECGYPTLPGDAFCRGCGRPHAAMTCPACGAPRGEQEPFCGRCGARFPS